MARFSVPSAWRARPSDRIVVAERSSFDSEDGEELGDVDETVARRVLDQQRGNYADSERRLSRESVGCHPLLEKPLANQCAAWKKDLWMTVMTTRRSMKVEPDRFLGSMALDLVPSLDERGSTFLYGVWDTAAAFTHSFQSVRSISGLFQDHTRVSSDANIAPRVMV